MAVRCRQFGISRKILTHALQRLDFPLYAPPQMQDEFPRGYEEQEKAQDANDTAPTQS